MLDLIVRHEDGDIAVAEGKIVEVGENLQARARKEIDATGLLLLPGLIDPHVHFNEPGRADWEGFKTGSRAAAAGGITTYFDMPLNSTPVTTTVEAFEQKRAIGEQKSMVDFALWAGLIPDNLDQLAPLAAAGAIGFKAFMCDSGLPEFPAIDDHSLREGMKRIADTGLRLALHAERFTTETNDRPIQAELDAIGFAIECAEASDCPIHIVHVSHAACIDYINEQRLMGLDITCETCPHYYVFGEVPESTLAKCAPPIRDADAQIALWERLNSNRIDFIGSDHSPCPPGMKALPLDEAWGGISGVQHGLALTWTRGMIDPEQLCELFSANAAEIFGLARKGKLEVGCDADFVLFEPGLESEIEADSLLYRHPHSPYTGRRINGRVRQTLLRGQVVYADGQPAIAPLGQWIRPNEKVS